MRVFAPVPPALGASILVLLAASTAIADDPPALDDPRFQIAREFVAMINDGSEPVVRAFETRYRSAARANDRPMEERVAMVRRLQGEFGKLKLTRAVSAAERGVRVIAEGELAPAIELTFELDAEGRLEGVRVAVGREAAPDDGKPLDAAGRAKLIDEACKALEGRYVYPEVAAKMAALVREKHGKGAYENLADELALTRQLTEDFRSVSKDRHLGVLVQGPPPPETGKDLNLVEMAGDNFGYRKVEILPGNIGYLRFDLFVNHPAALERATAAFGFLADVDALIVDMRYNGGGDPEAIRFITSYLFADPVHLNDMVDRRGQVVEEFWTLKDIAGKRLRAGIPIAVLTSKYTFSGAEEFAYNLQNLKRATIIGETTGGGAHPVESVRLSERVVIHVPYMRARNPVSRTNWEGVGVTPDIAVPAPDALERAQKELGARRTPAKP